jgi:guanylate kinase
MEKLLIIISSPSGGGKTTICKKLLSDNSSPLFEKAQFSISATTRKARGSEINGVDYIFLSKEEFEAKIQANEFLEHANVFGNLYGSLKSEISKTKHTIFDIDVAGHNQIKAQTEALSIFLLPPSLDVLKQRVSSRGDLKPEEIETRISIAPSEITESYKYNYIIINNDITQTFQAVCGIITSYILKKNHEKLLHAKDFQNFIKTL